MSFFLILLIAVLAFAYALYARDSARERRRVGGRTHIFDWESGPIEYALEGEGPTILSIHGTGGGFDQALDIAEPYLRAGFRILAPSRFGYLRSSYPRDPSPARQADALAQLVGELGLAPVAAIGVSAGAHTAIELALRHPHLLSALIRIVPSAWHPGRQGATPQLGRWVQAAFSLLLRFDFPFWAAIKFAPRLMIRTILATPPAVVARQPADEQGRVLQVLWHILPVSMRFRGLRTDGERAGALAPTALEQISTPTLAISAQDDLFGTCPSAQYVAARVERGEFVGFPTGGHLLAGRSAELAQSVVRFLREHGPKCS